MVLKQNGINGAQTKTLKFKLFNSLARRIKISGYASKCKGKITFGKIWDTEMGGS